MRQEDEPSNGDPPDDLRRPTVLAADVGRQSGVTAKTVRGWLSLPTTNPRHLRGEKIDGRWRFHQRDVDARKRRLLE